MGRLILFLIIAGIAGVLFIIKSAIGIVSRNEQLKNSTFTNETKKVMDKTAKGLNWMEKQWEKSRKDADSENSIKKDD